MTTSSLLVGVVVDAALGLRPATGAYTVERDVAVPMPDGVCLLGDRYRPAGDTGPSPVVLVRTPYGRAGLGGQVFAAPLARRGLQVFLQATRGTFGSGGHFRPFTTEGEAGLAPGGWRREQRWGEGGVAMPGGSFSAPPRGAVAPYAAPPLAAVSPHITAARATVAFCDHGVPQA